MKAPFPFPFFPSFFLWPLPCPVHVKFQLTWLRSNRAPSRWADHQHHRWLEWFSLSLFDQLLLLVLLLLLSLSLSIENRKKKKANWFLLIPTPTVLSFADVVRLLPTTTITVYVSTCLRVCASMQSAARRHRPSTSCQWELPINLSVCARCCAPLFKSKSDSPS